MRSVTCRVKALYVTFFVCGVFGVEENSDRKFAIVV